MFANHSAAEIADQFVGAADYPFNMAVTAYILIQTDMGRSTEVAAGIAAITGVISSEQVTGPYDVIVRAEVPSLDDLGKTILSRIQMVDGITRTITCPVIHP